MSRNFATSLAIRWRSVEWGNAMANKAPKTEAELSEVIMSEVRKHPECANIERVAIFRPLQPAPHHPNWSFAWVRKGAVTAPLAGIIARRLQGEFDLA
jgi:hypothetical protein